MFRMIDNVLINKFFQPVCDHIRKKHNWSKRILIVIALIVAIISLAPLMTVTFIAGYSVSCIFFLPAIIMLLWILAHIHQVVYLISVRFSSETKDSTRLTEKQDREWTMLLSAIALSIVIATLITYPDADVRIVALTYLIGGIANICASYFKACVDSSS